MMTQPVIVLLLLGFTLAESQKYAREDSKKRTQGEPEEEVYGSGYGHGVFEDAESLEALKDQIYGGPTEGPHTEYVGYHGQDKLEYEHISEHSPFCFKRLDKLSCSFNDTAKGAIVPEGMILPSEVQEVQISFATSLDIYPNCLPWITVINVDFMTTQLSKDEEDRIMLGCGYDLQVYKTKVDVLSYGVKRLNLMQSSVQLMDLERLEGLRINVSHIVDIRKLAWESEESFIANSIIIQAKDMSYNGNLTIATTHFAFLGRNGLTLTGPQTMFINSSISYIAAKGIKIGGGVVTFENVVIEKIAANGILVEDFDARLILNDVTFVDAGQDFIHVLDKSRILLNNVTANGEPLDISSEYIKIEYTSTANKSGTALDVNPDEDTHCMKDGFSITCDFSKVKDENSTGVVFHPQDDDYLAEIKNVDYVEVGNVHCKLKLLLENVHEGHIENPPYSDGLNREDCNLTLIMKNSIIKYLSLEYVQKVHMENTTVAAFLDTFIENLVIVDGAINTMTFVEILGNGSEWQYVDITDLEKITLSGPLTAHNVRVVSPLRSHSFVINHPDETTEMFGFQPRSVYAKGIVIQRGSLKIKHFHAVMLFEEAFYLEKGAFLHLELDVVPLLFHSSISVASRDQVVLEGGNRWSLESMITIREPHSFPVINNPSKVVNLTDIYNSPYCEAGRSYFLAVVTCEYSEVPNATVNMMIRTRASFTVQLTSAAFVNIYSPCVRKLVLVDVIGATTVDGVKVYEECHCFLEAQDVSFKNITSAVNGLFLKNCSVELLSLSYPITDIEILNTTINKIDGLRWTLYNGIVTDCYFGIVKDFFASTEVKILNVHIDKVLPRGLTFTETSALGNCTFKEIGYEGIVVSGNMHIKDVTIGKLSKRGILVRGGGMLALSNVVIQSAEELSIVALGKSAIAMQNVTVGGKNLVWYGYITDNLGPDDFSIKFTNRYDPNSPLSTEPTEAIPVESTFTPEIVTTKPEASAIPDNGPGSIFSNDSERSSESSSSASYWRTVCIVLAIMLVIVSAICIFLLFKYVKPKRLSNFPFTAWWTRDDQDTVLVSESNFGETLERASVASGLQQEQPVSLQQDPEVEPEPQAQLQPEPGTQAQPEPQQTGDVDSSQSSQQ